MDAQTPGTPPEDRQGLLRRWLEPALARRPRGDVVAASVGEGAHGVAVGKNIIQIGTLVIPVYAVAAVLALILISLAVEILRPVTVAETAGPTKMQGSFNVAVSYFGQEKPDGKIEDSPEGERLSAWVFNALQEQKKQNPDLSSVWIWHDSLPRSVKGVNIGYIEGDTPEARARAAAAKAANLGADMLIYGNLDARHRFVPEFYVASARGAGAGIQGHFKLGSDPIPVDTNANLALNAQLSTRSLALFWLAVGLGYDQGGRSAQALHAFRQAETLGDWQGAGQGKELLYFFIGQAALFQFATQPAGFNHADLDAEKAFQQALDINPGYAGALIGLGSVHLARAQNLQPPRLRLETADLQEALDDHGRAVAAAGQSPDRDWALYASPVALGMAYRVQGEAYLDGGNQAAAALAFEQAIARIEAGIPGAAAAGEYRLLGQAYGALGSAYAEKGLLLSRQGDSAGSRAAYAAAGDAFGRCVEQGNLAPLDQVLTGTVIARQCQPYRDRVSAWLAGTETP